MRTNKVNDFITRVVVRSFILMSVVTAILLAPRMVEVAHAAMAPTCEAGSHQVAGQCTPDPAPTGQDTARQDAAAEGEDALTLAYDPAPAPLWNALTTQHPEWYDEGPGDQAGHGQFMVPVGTVVDVPGGLYRATLDDGWMSCIDFQTSDQECSATGPVVPVDVPEVAPIQSVAHVAQLAPAPHRFTTQERKAARLILARLKTHCHVEEDWTWQGMPRVVGAHNDALSRAAQAAGLHGNNWPWSSKARTWLSQVVRTGKG